MAKPDTVVSLSEEDKEWLHNELINLDISIPEIPAPDDYGEILLALSSCMMIMSREIQEFMRVYKHIHGVKE
jgi:hypothetical protein